MFEEKKRAKQKKEKKYQCKRSAVVKVACKNDITLRREKQHRSSKEHTSKTRQSEIERKRKFIAHTCYSKKSHLKLF